MADYSLSPADAADLVRQVNEQRGGMRGSTGGRDPLPPPPPGPAAEEPPLPDYILAEMEAIRRGGFPAEGESRTFAEQPEGLQPLADTGPRVGTLAAPSGLVSPKVLAIRMGDPMPNLITSVGDVELTIAEEKALNQLCGRVLRRRMKEILAAVDKTYGG